MTSPATLGDLRRAGIVFFTREAVAVLDEVCRWLAAHPDAPVPRVDDIALDGNGRLGFRRHSEPFDALARPDALATLFDELLPPMGRREPDLAVPASLRLIGPRLRGRPGLDPIANSADLRAALGRYRPADPAATRSALWMRGRPGSPAAAPAGVPLALDAGEVPAVEAPPRVQPSSPRQRPAPTTVSGSGSLRIASARNEDAIGDVLLDREMSVAGSDAWDAPARGTAYAMPDARGSSGYGRETTVPGDRWIPDEGRPSRAPALLHAVVMLLVLLAGFALGVWWSRDIAADPDEPAARPETDVPVGP